MTNQTIDLRPAVEQIVKVVEAIGDDQLGNPTPCEGLEVAALVDHVCGLSLAFTWAARKTTPADAPPANFDGSRLDPDWRTLLPQRARELAQAWSEPEAWTGMCEAGGVTMPAEVMGIVALDELVIHGWDLSAATGQPFNVDVASEQAVFEFTKAAAEEDALVEGVFGPAFDVPVSGALFDRALGYAGRNPRWSAS